MLACMLALGATPGARAQEQEEAESEEVSPSQTVAPSDPNATLAPPWKPRLGMALDVGAPDGVGVSALVHPLRWLRVNLG
ncbi:MAG TPA: autotransporter outer membrane beta-barrel domain-containing protein, partial [Archangium sp.]